MATVVTTAGGAIITNRIHGAGTEPLNIGWGTGAQTTAVKTDTTLGPTTVEKLVDLSTSAGTDHTVGTGSQGNSGAYTSDQYVVTGTRTATGAGTVTVAGLFDAASGGNLFLKADFAGVALAISDSIAFTFKTTFVLP